MSNKVEAIDVFEVSTTPSLSISTKKKDNVWETTLKTIKSKMIAKSTIKKNIITDLLESVVDLHTDVSDVSGLDVDSQKTLRAVKDMGLNYKFGDEGSKRKITLTKDKSVVAVFTGGTKSEAVSEIRNYFAKPQNSHSSQYSGFSPEVQAVWDALVTLGFTYKMKKDGTKSVVTITSKEGRKFTNEAPTYEKLSEGVLELVFSKEPAYVAGIPGLANFLDTLQRRYNLMVSEEGNYSATRDIGKAVLKFAKLSTSTRRTLRAKFGKPEVAETVEA